MSDKKLYYKIQPHPENAGVYVLKFQTAEGIDAAPHSINAKQDEVIELFEKDILNSLENLVGQSLIIDLSALAPSLDYSADRKFMATLLNINSSAKQKSVRLVLAGVNTSLQTIIETARLNQLFVIKPDIKAASENLSGGVAV